jgi:TolB protein
MAYGVLVVSALTSCVHGGGDRPAIAYVLEQDDGPTRVIAAKEDGKEVWTLLQPGLFRAVPPSWSPDGKRLAFVRYRGPEDERSSEIVVVDADGSGERVVGEGAHPSWTSDSRFLVVERAGGAEGPSTIHVLSVDGGSERRLITGSEPTVSHSGTMVAFLRHSTASRPDGTCCVFSSSLHTIALDGSGLRRIVPTAGRGAFFARPVWLPDDSAIAVLAPTRNFGGPIVTYSLNGDRRVVARGAGAGAAFGRGETYEWAPTGNLVAYTRNNALYVVRADGRQVAAYADSNAMDIEWSPDGRTLAFSKLVPLETGQTISLFVVDVDAQEPRRIAFADADAAYFDWRPE